MQFLKSTFHNDEKRANAPHHMLAHFYALCDFSNPLLVDEKSHKDHRSRQLSI